MIILFLQYSCIRCSHVLKIWIIWVWYSTFYTKLVDCVFFKIVEQHIYFVIGMGNTVAGKEMLKYLQAFRKLPRFSLSSTWSHVTLFKPSAVSPDPRQINYNIVKDENKLYHKTHVFHWNSGKHDICAMKGHLCSILSIYESREQHKWRSEGTFY